MRQLDEARRKADRVSWENRAVQLFERLLSSDLSVSEFCDQYEPLWNFDLFSSSELGVKASVFEKVFDAVVWYSPFPEDRASYPGFKDEESIIAIVREALAEIKRR
jgi:hypothetical protein